MDAAVDAMKPLGFDKKVVTAKMRKLVKVRWITLFFFQVLDFLIFLFFLGFFFKRFLCFWLILVLGFILYAIVSLCTLIFMFLIDFYFDFFCICFGVPLFLSV